MFFCSVKLHHQISNEMLTEALDEIYEDQDSTTDILYEQEDIERQENDIILRIKVVKEVAGCESNLKPKLNSRKSSIVVMTEDEEDLMRSVAEMNCEACSLQLTGWVAAKCHYRTHKIKGFIRCCGRKIDRILEMKDHMAWHENPTIFTCVNCGKVLMTRENLMNHEATHIPEADRKFPCKSCPKRFGSSFALILHKKVHAKDTLVATIPCPECPNRRYKTQKQADLHMEYCHKKAGAFMCHYCSKVLKTKASLDVHIKSHTHPEEPIECNLCGHLLKNSRRFKIHMSKHSQAEQGPYQCIHCNKHFNHQSSLTAHISFVHTTNRFSCPQCDKIFKHKLALTEHAAQHTGIDLYNCPFCDRTFKSNANMHSHKKKMHPEEYAQLPLPSYLKPRQPVRTQKS